MKITTVGIDLAKYVIQVHGVDERGKAMLRKQLRRSQVAAFFANLPACMVGTPAQRLVASLAHFTRRISLPRIGGPVGLCNVLFEACSAFTRVTARTLTGSSKMTRYIRGFSHFVTSMPAPIACGWSDSRVGLSPTGKTPP